MPVYSPAMDVIVHSITTLLAGTGAYNSRPGEVSWLHGIAAELAKHGNNGYRLASVGYDEAGLPASFVLVKG
jgi:hypothetical protein